MKNDHEYSFEEKLWKGTGTLCYSVKPLLVYLFLPALLMTVGMRLFGGRSTTEVIAESGNFYYALGIGLTIYLLHRRSKSRGSSLKEEVTLDLEGLDWKKAGYLLGMGFCFGFFFSAALTVIPFPEVLMQSYSGSTERLDGGNDQWLALVSTTLLAPIAEEIVFRGYMLNRLLGWFREKHAVWIVSAIFALCHVSVIWIVYAFVMGLVLAKVSMVEDNITYSAVLHIGFNMNVLPIWLINHQEAVKQVVFASDLLIAVYGVAACGAGLWFWKTYKRGIDVW